MKNTFLAVPLCAEHHMPGYPQSYHQLEKDAWERLHRINCDWAIINLLSEYIDELYKEKI